MAKIEKFICDQCGKEKQSVNHWLEMRILEGRLETSKGLGLIGDDVKHICGHNCASILLARWMSSGSIDKPGDSSEKT
jgi:hypothetical protein